MYTIEELIEYYQETDFLDFKREEYTSEKNHALIKDVMAMANAHYQGERFIIIGLKKNGDDIEYFDVLKPKDSASVQQLILANITPELDIAYDPVQYQGHQLVVLRIKPPLSPPYQVKKDVIFHQKPVLRAGDMWIRKGSHQTVLGRIDLDRIYERKEKANSLEGRVDVSFMNGQKDLEVACVIPEDLPSQLEAKKLQDAMYRCAKKIIDPSPYASPLPKDEYEAMGLDGLKEALERVGTTFKQEDDHYLYEQMASKINFTIYNGGQEILKNAMLEVMIPRDEGLFVAGRVYHPPHSFAGLTRVALDNNYPEVVDEPDQAVATMECGDIRHRKRSLAFRSPLRIFASQSMKERSITLTLLLHAENLRTPQSFHLKLYFV